MAISPPKPVMNTATQAALEHVMFGSIEGVAGDRVILYGPGGIGKTTLACSAPGPVAFIDLDESLAKLKHGMNEATLKNITVVKGIKDWKALRAALQSKGWDKINTIILDSGTKAEELAVAHTLLTVKGGTTERPFPCHSIEDYGYGKGYTHVFDTFMGLVSDLDFHVRAGKNVIIISHDCTTNVPNPAGEDWIRYEPRLQAPASGKASIRLRLREWADHVLFYGYDVVSENGKGKGGGSRTIYPCELPHCMAKSRSTSLPIEVTKENASEFWKNIILPKDF